MKNRLIIIFLSVLIYAANLADSVNPIKTLTSADIPDISVSATGDIYIATQGGGIQTSTNGGINFKPLHGLANNITLFNNNFSAVHVDGNNIIAGGGVNQFGSSPGVFLSTDGGNIFNPIGLDGISCSEIYRGLQGKLYASTRGSGVQVFENNTFTALNIGLGTLNINTMYLDETDGEPLLAGGDNGLYKYDFTNQTWSSTSLNFPIYAFTEGENNTLYIATNNQIYETTDYENFNILPDLNLSGSFKFESIAFSTPNIYAAISPTNSEHDIPLVNYLNINTGIWEDDTEGLPPNPGIPQVIKISGGFKYLGTTTNFYSAPLTGPWGYIVEELNVGQYTSSSYNPYNGYFYAGGAQGMSKVSTDINGSWTKNDENLKLAVSINGYAHGTNGTIVLQSGAVNFQSGIGDPFERRENGLSGSYFSSIAYNSTNDILVLGGTSGLFTSNDWGIQWQATNFSGYIDENKYSAFRDEFYATGLDRIVRSDGLGQSFNTFVGNINPAAFAIKDQQDWKIGLADYNDFFEIDENGISTSLGYTGLGANQYLESVEWSISLNTWMGAKENKIYNYNFDISEWELSYEVENFILSLKLVPVSSDINSNETILVGTYGGGMLSNAALTSVGENQENNLNGYYLDQNFPNPFNPSTAIKYYIPFSSFVSIKVYDLLGKEVATLVNEEKIIGSYSVNFDASNLASGIYFYSINAGNFKQVKKMVLSK